MGNVTLKATVQYRDRSGRFISEVAAAGERTIADLVEEGAHRSRELAPIGHKIDFRTIPLRDSIFSQMESRTKGSWYSVARHAASIEFGARPHTITGDPDLSFYWEKKGRRYIPASQYYMDPDAISVVNHPGNEAEPFMRPAYEEVSQRVMEYARRNYPN